MLSPAAIDRVAASWILVPRAFSIPFELAVYLHSGGHNAWRVPSVTRDSSIVLAWNIATKCQGMDKDRKQLLQCDEAIEPVTTCFEIQLNTLYINALLPVPPPVNTARQRVIAPKTDESNF